MSKRDYDTLSRASHPDDFHLRSPAQPQPYTSLYFNPISAYTCPSAAIPPPSSILLGNGPPSHLASSGTKTYASRSTTPASSASDLSDVPKNMKEISPPPLRRSEARTESQVPIASNAATSTGAQPHSFPMQMPQFAAPPSRSSRASIVEKQWDKADLAKTLQEFLKGVRQDHSRLVAHAIEALEPTEWRVRNGADLFQGLGTGAVPQKKGETMRIKFKQHLKTRKDTREEHYEIKAIKTATERVPRYRFHHVEIKKNVLTPNTMLTFVPHLRDLDSSEEPKYNLWLKELEQIDTESGFKPMNREEKVILTIQTERAATVSLYLDTWLEQLGIANCTKATLVAHMASQEPSDKMTAQQKSDIIRSSREATDGNSASQDARKAAALFTDAFKQVFDNDDLPLASRIELRRSLLLEESVDGVLDPKAAAKDAGTGTQGDVYKTTEAHLATYSILGCLICHSHSCDHGEYDKENLKQTFSLSAVMPLSDLLKQRRRKLALESVGTSVSELTELPCRRECYLSTPPVSQMQELRPWAEEEMRLLKSIFLTLDQSKLQRDPICFAADILDRKCCAVYIKFRSLAVKLPEATRLEPPRVKALSWYDNRRKILIGDWQDHIKSHEHQRREIIEPCSHEGPCTQKCRCVQMGLLCEKWCRCTVDTCSYKFTGCPCRATGKSCQAKQKDKPCICVQLNRECDPELCGTCGALERADPHNANAHVLHETGCQNCELQRGGSKKLILGQSQLDGVGYGLFTAEDIAQDGFVIEYVGELITHDEGVRREARRGDVFDEESNISYVFTLLEHEGIWVDAATYGNLSRYINHATEHDRTGSNITPRILYVNGEFRIKFTALRDIQAGEELFFNYGENFPNLTKKLLDTKTGQKPVKPGRPPRSAASTGVARKAPKPEQKKMERKKPGARRRRRRTIVKDDDDDDDDDMQSAYIPPLNRAVKRKRGLERTSSDQDMYRTRESIPQTQWQESAAEDEDGLVEEATPNGGIRTRRILRARASETPTKVDKVKAAGRRGGARPGSGRPRKHPRPVPKLVLEMAEPAWRLKDLATALPWRDSLSASPQTMRQGRAEQDESDEVGDSQEWSTAGEDDASKAYRQDSRGEEEEDEATSVNGVEEEEEEEEEDDQDVVVRKRMDRATRNRRPPAKFRGDDF
ncbi:SET domain-containing protein [Beauveria bassiana ARSEF 2860]|uniref:SET domain-containing protein n=1 Tax=Beauveria bassiana (strain ARSEF 2860) TaxID=655819 RepID=J4UWF6_BEAB2|nr:SET domain-containing protein [Beauveria bassiana ARSEF 2860]EJP70647.1 SET domain-containing protein [Beauveria bassiana ARSEF 2860]